MPRRGEQLAQRAVLDVAKALSVISRLAVIPCSAKKASARSRKPVTVAARLVVVDLDVGEPGVVVDDRVHVVVADPRLGRIQSRERCERSPVTAWPGRRKRA